MKANNVTLLALLIAHTSASLFSAAVQETQATLNDVELTTIMDGSNILFLPETRATIWTTPEHEIAVMCAAGTKIYPNPGQLYYTTKPASNNSVLLRMSHALKSLNIVTGECTTVVESPYLIGDAIELGPQKYAIAKGNQAEGEIIDLSCPQEPKNFKSAHEKQYHRLHKVGANFIAECWSNFSLGAYDAFDIFNSETGNLIERVETRPCLQILRTQSAEEFYIITEESIATYDSAGSRVKSFKYAADRFEGDIQEQPVGFLSGNTLVTLASHKGERFYHTINFIDLKAQRRCKPSIKLDLDRVADIAVIDDDTFLIEGCEHPYPDPSKIFLCKINSEAKRLQKLLASKQAHEEVKQD